MLRVWPRLRIVAVAWDIALATAPAWGAAVVLDGRSLTAEDVARVARDPGVTVEIAPEAAARVAAGFDVVMEAAVGSTPVYGLNVGVGWNNDHPVFKEVGGRRVIDDELLALSRRFNLTSLRAHGGGIGPDMPAEAVRAGMLIRLNTLLSGIPGAQPAVADTYRAFLDRDVTPVVPSRGSVGEADITLASHIGLAMVGEWFAEYQGRRLPAKEALALAGITPLAPVGKDFLAIISTNALTSGQAALLARDARAYLDRAIVVFALSLEGFNGNIAPFLAETTEIRPFPGMVEAAARIRAALEGSYLWQPIEGRALQDPLSFRTAAYALGNTLEASAELDTALAVQINHTDDNPAAVAGPWHPAEADSGQIERYRVDGAVEGALYPTANFEMLPVAIRLEHLTEALARLSQNIVMQTIRFENPGKTHQAAALPRGADQRGPRLRRHAEAAGRALRREPPARHARLARHVRHRRHHEHASNAPLAVANLDRVLDNMYQLSSIQLLHAAQAIDLRRRNALGRSTRALLAAYRARIPFVTEDRVYTGDIAAGVEVLRGFAAVTP